MYKTFIQHIYMLNQFRCHVGGACEWPVLSLVTVSELELPAGCNVNEHPGALVCKEEFLETSERKRTAHVCNDTPLMCGTNTDAQKSNKRKSFQKLKELKLMQKIWYRYKEKSLSKVHISKCVWRFAQRLRTLVHGSKRRELLVNFLCHLLLSSHFIGTPLTAADSSE